MGHALRKYKWLRERSIKYWRGRGEIICRSDISGNLKYTKPSNFYKHNNQLEKWKEKHPFYKGNKKEIDTSLINNMQNLWYVIKAVTLYWGE